MIDIVDARPDRAVPPGPPSKIDLRRVTQPRSKREVAAFESTRGLSEMSRTGGAIRRRMLRWKR